MNHSCNTFLVGLYIHLTTGATTMLAPSVLMIFTNSPILGSYLCQAFTSTMNHALTPFILAAKLKGTAGRVSPSQCAAAAQTHTIPGKLTLCHGKSPFL
jgi:hypothetical protein